MTFLLVYLLTGGVITWLVGRLVGHFLGASAGYKASRVLASIASGLPLVMFVCAILAGSSDDDGRGAGMLAVASLGLLLPSLSCWVAVWIMRPKAPPEGSPAELGFSREVPRNTNS